MRVGLVWSNDMGTFHVTCEVENHTRRTRRAKVSKLLVDTGSETTWIPASTLEKIGVKTEKKDVAFQMANGETITRDVGFAILRVDGSFTIDEVVFAQRGDLRLLGARTLEGMNLRVDSRAKALVADGYTISAGMVATAELKPTTRAAYRAFSVNRSTPKQEIEV
ncbi:MAG: retropepsin-like domain-containing protein [Planctomycetes bacterium]|nr:retropepsin-like domain-containing protein [Planctomycetota bacterium]